MQPDFKSHSCITQCQATFVTNACTHTELTKFVLGLAAAPLVVNVSPGMVDGVHIMIVEARFSNG